MKKLFTIVIAFVLSLSLFTVISEHECEHIHAETYYCSECGEEVTNVNLNPATCQMEGMLILICENQNCSKNGQRQITNLPIINHDFSGTSPLTTVGRSNVAATCTSVGYEYTYCTMCGLEHEEVIPMKDHKYELVAELKPTCTVTGYEDYECSVCKKEKHVDLDALKHNYVKKVVTEVSCGVDGVIEYKCSRCNDKYSETVKALAHSFEVKEKVEPTCEEEGYVITECKNCKKQVKSILKPLGHSVDYHVVTEATCEEEGSKSGICDVCAKEVSQTVNSKGHIYPSTWTIEEEPSIFKEGLQTKECSVCHEKISEVIPKLAVPPVAYIGTGAGTVGVGAAVLVALKKKATKKVVKKVIKETAKEVVEKELLEPSFEEKTIVTCMKNDEFYKKMKIQKYLVIVESEYEEIADAISENEPSLTIIDLSDKNLEEEKENLINIHDELEAPLISLLVSNQQIQNQSELLNQLKEDEIIKNYIDINTNSNVSLVKLVLPVMKPDLRSDEGLENIGMVADALGIPGVSTIVDLYINGREIKETYEEGKEEGLSFVDKSTIISDLAAILGLDIISSVVGLVGDVDDIKSSIEAKVGGNEAATIKDAASDIIDVVSDIMDK